MLKYICASLKNDLIARSNYIILKKKAQRMRPRMISAPANSHINPASRSPGGCSDSRSHGTRKPRAASGAAHLQHHREGINFGAAARLARRAAPSLTRPFKAARKLARMPGASPASPQRCELCERSVASVGRPPRHRRVATLRMRTDARCTVTDSDPRSGKMCQFHACPCSRAFLT